MLSAVFLVVVVVAYLSDCRCQYRGGEKGWQVPSARAQVPDNACESERPAAIGPLTLIRISNSEKSGLRGMEECTRCCGTMGSRANFHVRFVPSRHLSDRAGCILRTCSLSYLQHLIPPTCIDNLSVISTTQSHFKLLLRVCPWFHL